MADILGETKFAGSLSKDGLAVDVTFFARVASDFRLELKLDALPAKSALPFTAMGKPGETVESLTLTGLADDGTKFFSDTIGVVGWQHSDAFILTLEVRKAVLTSKLEKPAATPRVRFLLRSFSSFSNPIIDTPLGKLQVWGNEKTVPNDEVSGSLLLQSDKTDVGAEWAAQADAFLSFVWRGMAFAHGGHLQVPRCEYYRDSQVDITYYAGSPAVAELPVIPFLEHGPFIEALAKRYFNLEPFPEMIWTVVGWLHFETTKDEGRFITGTTALETVVEHLTPKSQTTVVPKSDFAALRDELLKVVADSSLAQVARDIFSGKIQNLNSRTLSQKISTLRNHYGLSPDKYSDDAILAAIKLRNAIVHKGVGDKTDIWSKIAFVRELIADIVIHEIGYTDVRFSYVDGYKIVPGQSGVDGSTGADIKVE